MSQTRLFPRGNVIWDFVITEQLMVSRYGHAGFMYYKQFTPYGIEDPQLHPPQRIDQRTYEMALRIHTRQQASKP